ncbi:MAG: hypothetical protein RLZZ568_1068 [Cyanobacteriota bacterium]
MRQTFTQLYRKVLLPLCLSGWMVSCSPLNPFGWAQGYLDIAKLTEISNQRAVNLQGIVVNVAPFLEGGAYQIQDKTGKVWVKTAGELPKKGTVVSIRGEVAYEAIFIGPEKLGESYIIEITVPQPQETATSSPPQSSAPDGDLSPDPNSLPPAGDATVTVTTVIEAIETQPPATGPTAIAVVENQTGASQPSTPLVNVDTAANEATVSPPTAPSSPPKSVADSSTDRPVVTPPPPPGKPRISIDDQFLPHKRLAK